MEALARSGIGAIDLIDNDDVCISNLNRQIIALHSTVGKTKVDAAEERLKDINPDIKVKKFKTFYQHIRTKNSGTRSESFRCGP